MQLKFSKLYTHTILNLKNTLKNSKKGIIEFYRIYKQQKKHRKALLKIRKKDKITVLFLMILESNWKYDLVYRAFKKDNRFNPLVTICPLMNGEKTTEQTFQEMKNCENYVQQEGYDYINSWDTESKRWRNIKEELNPDIVFFTNPHSITKVEYCIGNFSDKLTCYVPYSVRSDHLIDLAFNQPFELLVWRNFYETEIHKSIAVKHAKNKGKNVIVAGYPTFDSILQCKKNNITDKKTIIWAPHWTIEKNPLLNRSCFLTYADFFIELADTFKDQFEIVLRPHPFLRETLNKESVWGKQKTDEYFKIWETRNNLSINYGDYIELFVNSDLMIHDSVSFLTEYLVTGNPAIFTQKEVELDPPFNIFGKKCLDAHYTVKNTTELFNRIENILIMGNDEKINVRRDFIQTQILPYKNSAIKIVNHIKEQLGQ